MQIEFASSGGVANRELAYRAESNTLSPERAKELERLVASSEVFELAQNDLNPNVTIGRADVISYHLIVSDGARHADLWFNDIAAPASIRPLLERLQQLARDQMGK